MVTFTWSVWTKMAGPGPSGSTEMDMVWFVAGKTPSMPKWTVLVVEKPRASSSVPV
jgi:hypothetical protein